MSAPSGQSDAPAWLFSFVDLAFLLLLAMTQLANPGAVQLGELIVPKIAEERTEPATAAVRDGFQLRVHPPEEGIAPFQLVRSTDAPTAEVVRVDEAELRRELAVLREQGEEKPALAPHEDSRSHDLLKAVELLEEQWPTRRRALVERVVATR